MLDSPKCDKGFQVLNTYIAFITWDVLNKEVLLYEIYYPSPKLFLLNRVSARVCMFLVHRQNHFSRIGSPLKCINAYPSPQAQEERYVKMVQSPPSHNTCMNVVCTRGGEHMLVVGMCACVT